MEQRLKRRLAIYKGIVNGVILSLIATSLIEKDVFGVIIGTILFVGTILREITDSDIEHYREHCRGK